MSGVVACGPEFPNSYFALPESALLAAPEAFFAAEIARIARDVRAPVKAVHAAQSTAQIERDELRRALGERSIAISRATWIAEKFFQCRSDLDQWIESTRQLRAGRQRGRDTADLPSFELAGLPEGLPLEFAEYFNGAVAWHRGNEGDACKHWASVLALPADQRRYRSTWAAFMIGRAWLREMQTYSHLRQRFEYALAEAKKHFALTREFEASGFPDPLGLAAESLGWEARVLLEASDCGGAIELYLQQYAAGDPTALESLRVAATRAADESDERLATIAGNAQARQVVTAYFISRWQGRWLDRPVRSDAHRWAVALQAAGIRSVPEADRLAWFAYEAGMFPLAWEWVALAPENVPEAQWLRAKLALRGGDLQSGEKLLRAALAGESLAEAHRDRIAAELYRVCLARDDFRGALTATLMGRHWEDVAFVAERIMTPDELVNFVSAMPTTPALVPVRARPWFAGNDLHARLRHLLARRLARRSTAAAEKYFPPEWQPVFHSYFVDVQQGFDVSQPASARAAAFWRAAQYVHQHGMELLGTELDPDWAIWDGAVTMTPAAEQRRGKVEKPEVPASVFLPSRLESKRLETQHAPEKRFHYRYRAAELGWWAASLLPNDSDDTAEMLATAGGWLKLRDPEAAKQFYQALVIRCGNTALGRVAAEKHWFPPTPLRDGG